MGTSADQIEAGIDQKRDDLKSNLEELESRVKSAADWRTQFERHPVGMMAAAVVGGMLLASLLGRK